MEVTFECRALTSAQFFPGPELVRFTLTSDGARDILKLADLAREHSLTRVERNDPRARFLMESDEHSDEEYLVRVDGKVLRVTADTFSYAAYIRFTQITVASEPMALADLAQAFQLQTQGGQA